MILAHEKKKSENDAASIEKNWKMNWTEKRK